MPKGSLERILGESEKDQYDIRLEIGSRAFIHHRKETGAHPESQLGLLTLRKVGGVPLRRYATFDILQDLIEKAVQGNIDVVVAENPNGFHYQENGEDNGKLFAAVTPHNGYGLSSGDRLSIQQQLKKNAEAILRARFQDHISSLTPLSYELTGKTRRLYIQDLKNTGDKLEALEEAADLLPTSKWGVKINRVTWGLYRCIIKEWVKSLSKTYLAWSILGANSRQFAEHLSADADHLERNGRTELGRDVHELSSFYKELSAIASYAQRGNKNLLDYLSSRFNNIFGNLPQIQDIESVKEGIVKKVSGLPVQLSAAQISFKQAPSGYLILHR